MVVSAESKPITLDEFKEYVERPENSEHLFELINGEIVDVSPGRTSNSFLSMKLDRLVYPFCVQHNLPCFTSGGDGAYHIEGHVLAPDFAYKPTPMSDDYPDPDPPLWAVEIISPTDRAPDIRAKRQIYLGAGILYWEMYPDAQSIDLYAPGQLPRTAGIDETLDGGTVLPGFTLSVKDIFENK